MAQLPSDPISSIMKAISQVESGGNYSAVGPATSSGDRALGKYQVMGNNVAKWTEEALGRAYSKEEFLKNPQIQDAVARYKMSKYYGKYKNPGDVASLWFSGRPMKGNVSKDVLGTSVPQYVKNVVSLYNKYGKTSQNSPTSIEADPIIGTKQSLTQPSRQLYARAASGSNVERALKAMGAKTTIRKKKNTQSVPQIDIRTGKLGTITTPFGGSTRYEPKHPGIDIANDIGTPIPAFSSGKVIETVFGKKQGDAGYGNYVVVQDEKGNKHQYSHLQDELVKMGDTVRKGQSLGLMGNTGSTYSTSGGTGSHLDYRIRDAYGKYVNPSIFLKQT